MAYIARLAATGGCRRERTGTVVMHSHTVLCRALAHPQPSAREGVMILIGGKAIVSMHWPSSKKIQGTITVVLRNGRLITAGHVVGEEIGRASCRERVCQSV